MLKPVNAVSSKYASHTNRMPKMWHRPKHADRYTDSISLLAAVLERTPALPEAACRSKPHIFDGDQDDDHTEAINLCRQCPARQACERWAASVPPGFVTGVVAGVYRPAPHTGRKHAPPQHD